MQKNRIYDAARCIFAGLCLALAATSANAADFTDLQKAAKGQTVYFNAWGGDAKINSYISWAGKTLSDRHDITLVHVKLTDTASAVSRILAEKTAGRNHGGSIDLLWVNGENFAAMKRVGLLQDQPWVTSLPNWRYTDSKALPAIMSDFAEPTNGKESPWGRAQLVFSYDSARLQTRQNQPRHWLIILPQIRVVLPFRSHQISLACRFSNRF